jgi:hypothetical protein
VLCRMLRQVRVQPLRRSCQTVRRNSTVRCVLRLYHQHRLTCACAPDLLALHRWLAFFESPTGAMHEYTMACFVAPLNISSLSAVCLQLYMLFVAIQHLIVSVCCMSAILHAVQSCTSAANWHWTCIDLCGCCCIGADGSIISSVSLCSV